MRTVEILDIKGEYWYHGRVQAVDVIAGKNVNVTKHLLEDKEDGTVVIVGIEKIKFKDDPIIRGQR